MSEAAPAPTPAPSPAPAPAPAPSPAPTPTPAPAPAPTPAPADPAAPAPYKIPDAYKDKPWAAKVKSEDDLWKQLDNTQGLLGKKTLPPIDLKTAKPEEIDAHFHAYRPSEATAYAPQFGEGCDPAFVEGVSKIFFDAGLSEHQSGKIVTQYQALEKAQLEAATSADGFKAVMVESFGDAHDAVIANAQGFFKTNLSEASQQVLDVMPNQYLRPLYELAEAHKKEVDALKKQYGVTENGDAHLNQGGNIAPADINKVRSDLRRQISEIDTRPHTVQERQELVDKLHATYANQPAGKK